MTDHKKGEKKIVVSEDGPYKVYGGIPLVRKTQVVTEYGEPITWKKEETIETSEYYELCRCGQSQEKPFCDFSHVEASFDGSETADTQKTEVRRIVLKNGKNLVVYRDRTLCIQSGFCGNRFENIPSMMARTDDTRVRSQVIAMVERCPSGSYTYSIQENEPDIEPDLPEQIAATTEMTDDGPIMGPLWVTGNIPIERSDGQPLETRNRVTLCRCGRSSTKPLCDGSHRIARIKPG
jgi:CDGSH-type Zn-finger protein